jgi:hypothetical protein
MDAGRLELVEGDVEIVPGSIGVPDARPLPAPPVGAGGLGGETACFLADVVPTLAHLPLPWIMGYDVEPLVTLESKRALLKPRRGRALAAGEHARPVHAVGARGGDGKGVRLEEAG